MVRFRLYQDSPISQNFMNVIRSNFFNRMWPLEEWDRDEWLPKIHAVEFLGEPQYGGGRPVPPQEVFESFLPYRTSRLATSVTHSEERIWRYYAGCQTILIMMLIELSHRLRIPGELTIAGRKADLMGAPLEKPWRYVPFVAGTESANAGSVLVTGAP